MIIPLVIVLFLSVVGAGWSGGRYSSDLQAVKDMSNEEREAWERAELFVTRLKELSDIQPIAEEMIARDLFDRFLQDPDNYPILPLDSIVVSQLSREERRQYYTLMVNFHYLSSLYVASKFSLKDGSGDENVHASDMYPTGVSRLLKTNKTLAALVAEKDAEPKITSVAQVGSIRPIMEKVVAVMREYMKRNPIEQSQQYEKNISYLKEEDCLMEPWLTTCDEECYGFPKGTHLINVNVPFLQLSFVKSEGQLKMLSVAPYIR